MVNDTICKSNVCYVSYFWIMDDKDATLSMCVCELVDKYYSELCEMAVHNEEMGEFPVNIAGYNACVQKYYLCWCILFYIYLNSRQVNDMGTPTY